MAVLIDLISLLLCTFIKKKLIIQCIPFFAFLLFPIVISSTIGNIFHLLGEITGAFVPFQNLTAIYSLFQYDFNYVYIISTIIPYIVYSVLLYIIYKINTNKYSRDCL